MNAKFYRVGGYVRDEIMGRKCNDIDYAVEATSYEAMKEAIVARGCKRIFLESPEYFTIRALDPKHGAVDFVLCRKDGEYTDGRRPDSVEAGTLLDDLARRDFTMNAIAKDEQGNLIDPYDGAADIKKGLIRCVGRCEERFEEDALRMLRAIRFSITLNMCMEADIAACLQNPKFTDQIDSVSVERIREELLKCFAYGTVTTLKVLGRFPRVRDICFKDGLRLMPTLKHVKV